MHDRLLADTVRFIFFHEHVFRPAIARTDYGWIIPAHFFMSITLASFTFLFSAEAYLLARMDRFAYECSSRLNGNHQHPTLVYAL